MTPIQSLPYRPDPAKCCDGCCFGGKNRHAEWCPQLLRMAYHNGKPTFDFWRPATGGVSMVPIEQAVRETQQEGGKNWGKPNLRKCDYYEIP